MENFFKLEHSEILNGLGVFVILIMYFFGKKSPLIKLVTKDVLLETEIKLTKVITDGFREQSDSMNKEVGKIYIRIREVESKI